MKICPECFTPLVHKKHKIFHCWVCPEGHGTLYPAGELEQIVSTLSGLGDLEMRIWGDKDRYSIMPSHLKSPENGEMMREIRDKERMGIMVYGDPVTHSLWMHTGEEEKLLEHIEREMSIDSVGSYAKLAAEEAIKIFDDDQPLDEVAGHMVISLKLLGERILRSFPHVTL